uniref:Histone deacetylase domain-containing protein n=1 Tax=Gossypium raimondii TaxID=29730 RepID=A0A0D2VH08_GOSRA|nr:hypothetical protein B456_013G220000 [Gossypium raimondii]
MTIPLLTLSHQQPFWKFRTHRVIANTTESTRNLCKSTLYLFLALATPFIAYRCFNSFTMFWSSSSSSSQPATKIDAESLRRQRINSSKLYQPDASSKVPVIYSSYYDISFLGIEKLHPFDSSKWGRICRFLMSEGYLEKKSIVDPLEASRDDLLVVPPVAMLPNWLVQMKVLYPFRRQVGGTVLAAKLAMDRGWAINVGGGFHHCSGGRGGGFCAYADISLCIHFAFVRLNISRVMIIDLDAHQGNGHEMDFGNDERVYILDMYNPGIYPFDMTARNYINQKVEVVTGTATVDYLDQLDKALAVAGSNFAPELIVYNAGTDILDGDPLGGLKVSPEGVIKRDEKVFRFARDRKIPIVMVTSGGYMKTSARVIADSIINLSNEGLIETNVHSGRKIMI